MKKNRTYFTKKEIVSFGNYLLSKEREDLVLSHPVLKDPTRLREVSHADIENWKFRNGK